MQYAILVTAAVIVITGFALELATMAEETSNKALDFSNEMSNAMDCAITGRPIEECSPALMGQDAFRQDATGFISKAEEIDDELGDILDEIPQE